MNDKVRRFGEVAPLLVANGYAVVPLVYGEKRPSVKWSHYKFKPADAREHAQDGTGILCGAVVALDIDVRRAALAEEIEALATALFGQAPRRVGQAPKRLLLFRTDHPFAKLQTAGFRFPEDDPEDKRHAVEVLAQGEQFVAYNRHPVTGAPYEWNGVGEPLTVPVQELRPITQQQAAEFLARAETLIRAAGGIPTGKFRQQDSGRPHEPNERLLADVPGELLAALAALPNDDVPYDDWIYVGLAVKGALGEAGWEPFRAWSAKSSKFDAAETLRAWDSFQPHSIGAGTVFHLAAQAGWQRPLSPVTPEDFYGYMPDGRYLFIPTGELWPGKSVNQRCGDETAAHWINKHRPVDQMTWAPGEPELIRGRLISRGGWVAKPGCATFNLYRPPTQPLDDLLKAERWLQHWRLLVPDEAELTHILRWLAHRVQHPGEKINHALLLSGPQGIGKDSVLEPVKRAVGPWNFEEVTPKAVVGRFNGFVKSVVLRVNEAHDLGDFDRYAFYERMKLYTAAPPDVLRCDEKNLREHSVVNVTGVILTTNYKESGVYLPADDRRTFVVWSDLTKDQFPASYWQELWA
jgi:hypothetical protein